MLATAFDRLGGLVFRARWIVLLLCLVAAALGVYGASGLQQAVYGSTVELQGTPSYEVAEAVRTRFDNPYGNAAVVTLQTPSRTLDTPSFAEDVQELERALRAAPDVRRVMGYLDRKDGRLRSADGHTTALVVGLTATTLQDGERAIPRIREVIRAAVAGARQRDPALRVATTGHGAIALDVGRLSAEDSNEAEGRSLPLTALFLILAFGALVAALLPLAMGVLATVITLGILTMIAHHLALGAMVQTIASMLGLAVGIDYSLFMVSRFREALARGQGVEAAVRETMRTAGVSIACSGFTVMIGLAGLWFTPSLDLRSIALGGALVVAVGVLVALTLLPALLSLLGPRVNAPSRLARWLRPVDPARWWAAWARGVVRRPALLASVGLLLLAAMIAPLRGLSTEFADSRWVPAAKLEFHEGLDMLEAMGRLNSATPLNVLVTARDGEILDAAHLGSLQALSAKIKADPRVLSVDSPVDLGLEPAAYAKLYKNWHMLQQLQPERFGMVASRDGRQALLQVVGHGKESHEDLRALARDIARLPLPANMALAVGGEPAYVNDLYDATYRSIPGMVAFVVGATFLLLAAIYRSVLVPLKATLLNLASVGAGCGALVAAFQWGWGKALLGLPEATGGVPLTVLVLVFCVVFGLSMDYEVFLLSRIHEGFLATNDNARATEDGLAATGGPITCAALIMATVFGGFALAKLVVIQMLGFGLAVAILVDAAIIRVLVAPALMRLAGRWNWWPGHRNP